MRKLLGALAAFVVASSAWAGVAGAKDSGGYVDQVNATISFDATLALTAEGADGQIELGHVLGFRHEHTRPEGSVEPSIQLGIESDGAFGEEPVILFSSLPGGWVPEVDDEVLVAFDAETSYHSTAPGTYTWIASYSGDAN